MFPRPWEICDDALPGRDALITRLTPRSASRLKAARRAAVPKPLP
jgi:hypothetical protein